MASEGMVTIYVYRIKRGLINIDDVPDFLRERVEQALEND